MIKKTIKKLIDEEPEYYYMLYRDESKPEETHLYERQRNTCRDALLKILKEGIK